MAVKFGTVTALDPLRVQIAGAPSPQPTQRSLVREAELSVGDGVTVEIIDRLLTVIGRIDGLSAQEMRDFNDDPITSGEIEDGAILEAKLAEEAVTRTKIVDDAIDASKVAQGNVVRALMAVQEIDGTHIGDDAISTPHIIAGAIETAHMVAGTIDGDRIAAFSIEATRIASYNLTAQNASFETGIIQSAMIGTGQITTAKIGTAQITTAKIGTGQITTAKIGDAQITTAKIGDVSADKITTGSISVSTFIQSSNYTSSAGWRIDGDGDAWFRDVVIRGDLETSNFHGFIQIRNTGTVTNPGLHVGNLYGTSDHVWLASFGSGIFNITADVTNAKHFRPQTDNGGSLGASTHRWTELWAVNGSIRTSDTEQKSDIQPVNPTEALDRVVQVANEATIRFRWNDGVRNHAGFDAQKIGNIHSDNSAAYIDPLVEANARVNPWAGEPTQEWIDDKVEENSTNHSTVEELEQEAVEFWLRRRTEFDEETEAMKSSPKGIREDEMMPDLYAAIAEINNRLLQLEGN